MGTRIVAAKSWEDGRRGLVLNRYKAPIWRWTSWWLLNNMDILKTTEPSTLKMVAVVNYMFILYLTTIKR